MAQQKPKTRVSATPGKMAAGLVRSTAQALKNGKVSEEIREERMETCRACPLFKADDQRCKSCGCYMPIKSWIGGDPDTLCPSKKWNR